MLLEESSLMPFDGSHHNKRLGDLSDADSSTYTARSGTLAGSGDPQLSQALVGIAPQREAEISSGPVLQHGVAPLEPKRHASWSRLDHPPPDYQAALVGQ